MRAHISHFLNLLKKIGIAFVLFTLCRLFFIVFNSDQFSDISPAIFFYGLRFDLVAITYFYAPIILLELLPFRFRNTPTFTVLLKILFYITSFIVVLLNMIDVGYFRFSAKRSTADLFQYLHESNDMSLLLPQYLKDYWYLLLLLLGMLCAASYLYKWWITPLRHFSVPPYSLKNHLQHILILMASVGLSIIGIRGGLQLRPLTIIDAGKYANATHAPALLNTPFTMLHTLFNDGFDSINYYSQEQLKTIYEPVLPIKPPHQPTKKNVVVIILESFSKEYIGALNNNKGYTPFLDTLIKQSTFFPNTKANGLRSIEALPAIFSSIPALTNTAYINSRYANNALDGLPQILNDNGYHTSFYHGGANGTMGFNGFSKFTGIQEYFGMNEYPNKKEDYDGLWGIFDEPYLQYYVNELDKKTTPFFSTIFTLSSHQPYTLPEKWKNKFPKGALPVHETIGYTDYALRQFFMKAKTKEWYNNTLFVITADHAAQAATKKYKNLPGAFAIPLLFFDPSNPVKNEQQKLAQHIDIPASILHLLGISDTIVSFGNNLFESDDNFTINHANNMYMTHQGEHVLYFNGEETTHLFHYKKDSLLYHNLLPSANHAHDSAVSAMETLTKAFIQQYNNRLLQNQLSHD